MLFAQDHLLKVRSVTSLTSRRPLPRAEKAAEGYRLSWRGVAVMGVLNVTPDSFSDGGQWGSAEAAVQAAEAMAAAGALIVDVGGESTRPGAEPVSVEVECDRVLPVIRALEGSGIPISVDTRRTEVAAAALAAGAHIINDVSGLRDPQMIQVCAEKGVPAVIMHMRGEPRTMQQQTDYADLEGEVFGFLREQAERALAAGVPSVVLDPGLGFAKTAEQNVVLLKALPRLVAYGYPVLVGASRKSFVGKLSGIAVPSERDSASVAVHLFAASRGAALVRVHNVPAHVSALATWEALHHDAG
jgi:Dihydropteroate synthase (EC 2.5.1.15)